MPCSENTLPIAKARPEGPTVFSRGRALPGRQPPEELTPNSEPRTGRHKRYVTLAGLQVYYHLLRGLSTCLPAVSRQAPGQPLATLRVWEIRDSIIPQHPPLPASGEHEPVTLGFGDWVAELLGRLDP